jgi:hypothetical protein
MTPVMYTSFCTAKNALAVAPKSPPNCRGQTVTQELSAADKFFY